jgi:hypothetical protein
VIATGNLEVGGHLEFTGADCAEEFDLADDIDVDAVEPGTVMIIESEGALRCSATAYDRRVAGVVAGAGDYRPGLVLGRRPGRRRVPVALVGRVFCKADARYAAIGVGDLLTTSPTVGHAMRASDPADAFGAVLGKALRPLQRGCALIPILVALQ